MQSRCVGAPVARVVELIDARMDGLWREWEDETRTKKMPDNKTANTQAECRLVKPMNLFKLCVAVFTFNHVSSRGMKK